MKIINKILAALVALPIVAGLASCSEKEAEYLPAPIIAGQEVYIPSTANTTINLTPGTETKAEAYFDICRVKSEGEVTVPLKVTSSSEKYKVANEVKFENGSKVGKMVITYDPTQLVPGEFDTISVAISDPTYTTPYGKSSAVLLIGQPEPWVSLGWGTFNETFYFGIEDMDVEIFQNELSPNTYRIKNPFLTALKAWGEDVSGNVSEYLYFRVLKAGDELFGQTIPEDGFVYFYSDYTAKSLNTGYTNTSYNDDICLVFPGAFTSLEDPSNWKHNIVLDYKDKENLIPGYVQLAPYYYMFSVGGWNQTLADGVITILMPDFTLEDYSADIDYKGKFIALDKAVSAEANVTLGADVASAKIGMYPGKASSVGIKYVTEYGQEIQSSGEYKIAFPEGAETGIYTVYVVSFDGDGAVKEYSYDEFRYEAPGEVEETWTPMYVGTWEYSLDAFCNEDGTPYYDEGLVLSVCDQDETKYKISHLWFDVDFIFTIEEDNTLSFEDQQTGANYGYGDLWASDLSTYQGFEEARGYIDDKGVFHFSIYYYDDDYSWGNGYETFTLTGKYEASAAAKKAPAKRNVAKRTPKSLRNDVELGSHASSCKISNGVKAIKLTKETVR